MSVWGSRHPLSITKKPRSLKEVLEARPVTEFVSVLESARLADGAAAIIVASSEFLDQRLGPVGKGGNTGKTELSRRITIMGGGEGSGPFIPPSSIDETMFSCGTAAQKAYQEAQMSPNDINFFGLYDCFPVCLIRAIEAVGIAEKGQGGEYIEQIHRKYKETGKLEPEDFPINTHGGLLGFGAPWEVPAAYNIIEAVA